MGAVGLALASAWPDGASSSTKSSPASLVETSVAAPLLSQLPSTTCARSSQWAGPSTLSGTSLATCSTPWMRPSSTSSTTLPTLSTRSHLCFPAGLVPRLILRRLVPCWVKSESQLSTLCVSLIFGASSRRGWLLPHHSKSNRCQFCLVSSRRCGGAESLQRTQSDVLRVSCSLMCEE